MKPMGRNSVKDTFRRIKFVGTPEQAKSLAEVFETRGKDLTRHDLYTILTALKVGDGFAEEDFL